MNSHVLLRRASAALALAAFLSACGGDDGTGPGGFELTATPTALNLVRGTSAATQVTVRRTGTFSGPVTITAEGLPSGVTATVTPSTLEQGRTTLSVITLTAPEATAAGNVSFTVRAHGDGVSDQTSTVTVNVVDRQTFMFTTSATPVVIDPGTTKGTTVTLTRTGGFNGEVNFTLEGLPAGVTATPVSTTGNTATFTLSALPTAAAGTVTVLARGKTPNLLDYTAPFTLTVTGFAVAPAQASVAVAQGSTTALPVNISRTQYNGAVDFTVEGLPAGVTANTTTSSTGSTSLTLTAGATAAPGSYTITVRAKSPGFADRTTTTTLTIAPPNNTGVEAPLIATAVPMTNQSAVKDSSIFYRIYVPAGATRLQVTTTGATTDLDLYVYKETYTAAGLAAGCAAETSSGNETCTINNPAAGTYLIEAFAFRAFSNVTLTATVTRPDEENPPPVQTAAARKP